MGKSSTGKDSFYKKLMKDPKLGLKNIVMYTTRPIRAGEKDGVEYHFVKEQELFELQSQGKVIECRSYDTVHGIWYYFTVDDRQIDLKNHPYIMIGTLESYLACRAYFGKETLKPIYIEVDDGVRLQRALDRERAQDPPKYQEMCRRYLADSEDFSEDKIKEAEIERRFINDDFDRCLEEISDYIKTFL